MSPLPVAKLPPLGLGATLMTEFLWPCNMSCVLPVLGSQNWTPRSLEPERTQAPSGVSATERTKSYDMLASETSNLRLNAHLVSFESLNATASLGSVVGMLASGGSKLPHLDSLI